MKKHLVVISVDAFVFEDLAYARTLPNFARLLDGASMIERVKTIYPSLTHPVHATLITGAPAGVTGIINNGIFKPAAPDTDTWQWYNILSEIKCDTILHAAKRAGLTTASSTWPMTAYASDAVDYLVPSALNYYFKGREDDPLGVYKALGASDEMIEIIAEAVKRFGSEDKHPEYDELQVYCATEIIKKYKPNLLLIHPSDVDSKRHRSGVFSERVKEAIARTDVWLGKILDAIDEAGITANTDVVLLSDHGQINITRVISPNVWLVDKGYIKLNDDGTVKEWDAYVKSAGASAQVYLSRPSDAALHDEVYKLLSDMASEGIYGFERVYTKCEVEEKYGLSGDFSFVLETDGFTSFGERLVRPAVSGFDLDDYRFGRATHGHEPTKGPQPPFIVKGPSFKSGVVIPTGNILNHAPTIAAALGVELRDAVGTPVTELLK
ncbi:MAG: alkaline phosphatase family protein [Clostridia bacterium]|nr:alkaline phosphatase family protein [Clostridia bacterium]